MPDFNALLNKFAMAGGQRKNQVNTQGLEVFPQMFGNKTYKSSSVPALFSEQQSNTGAFQQLLNSFNRNALPNLASHSDNPLLNFATGLPLQITDETGMASIDPTGKFEISGNAPNSFRAAIDPMDQSVSIGKGPFSVTGGISVNPMTNKTGPRFNFAYAPDNPQAFRLNATVEPNLKAISIGKGIFDLSGSLPTNPLTNKLDPTIEVKFDTTRNAVPDLSGGMFLNQFLNTQPTEVLPTKSEARAYADEQINKARALNPYSYVMDRIGNYY